MRIAMIFRKLNIIGGSQRHALNMAVKLQEMGHEVTLYAIHGGNGGFSDVIKKFRVVSLEVHHAPVYSKNPLGKLISFLKNIRNENTDARALAFLIDPNTDVLNPHHDPIAYKVAYYFKRCVHNVPSVWTMNDLTTRQFLYVRDSEVNSLWKSSRIKQAVNAIADWCEKKKFIASQDAISVLDDRDRKWAEEMLGREAVVVRSGIEVSNFPYRKRTDLQKNVVSLFTTGIFFPHRRFEDIIEAMKLCDAKGVRADLFIVGKYEDKDSYYRKVSERVRAKGLEARVHFLGEVSEADLIAHYRKHDIFILSSHLQSWGIATFEAMACGMPVIVSNSAGAAEVLRDGENALLIDPKNPQKMADAILRLIGDPRLYASLSEKGREFTETRISWNESAKNILALFNHVLEKYS